MKKCGGRNISDSKMMRLELDMCGTVVRLPVKAKHLLSLLPDDNRPSPHAAYPTYTRAFILEYIRWEVKMTTHFYPAPR
jgi:hypothetical protein